MSVEQRIGKLEAALGLTLPPEYRAFLTSHRESDSLRVVSTNPDYWDVRSIFEVGDAGSHLQADRCYALLADVVPAGMLPVAEDQGGNLYLVDCRAGPNTGAVYWWDHEQGLGENRVSKVTGSFAEFLAALVLER